MHWFPTQAKAVLDQSKAILEQRGAEYGDSWADPQTPFLDQALVEIPSPKTPEEKRILMLASLCDVKLSRIRTGQFKLDSHIDFNNYNSAFGNALSEYLSHK